MFQYIGNNVLKGATFKGKNMLPIGLLKRKEYAPYRATFKGKNMLPIGSIFFPFKEALIRVENNFKGY